eukprot:PhM_4_TR12895/c0_g1_i1/m.88271
MSSAEIQELQAALDRERAYTAELASRMDDADSQAAKLDSELKSAKTRATPIGNNNYYGAASMDSPSYESSSSALRLEILQMRRISAEQGLQLKMALASAEAGRKTISELEQLVKDREDDLEYVAEEFRVRGERVDATLAEKDGEIDKLINEIRLLETLLKENEESVRLMRGVVADRDDQIEMMRNGGGGGGKYGASVDSDPNYESNELQRAYDLIREMESERDVLMNEIERLRDRPTATPRPAANNYNLPAADGSDASTALILKEVSPRGYSTDRDKAVVELQAKLAQLESKNASLTQELALVKKESQSALSIAHKKSETQILQCKQEYTQEIERVMMQMETLHKERANLEEALRDFKDSSKKDTDRMISERRKAETQAFEESRLLREQCGDLQSKVLTLQDDVSKKSDRAKELQMELSNVVGERDRALAEAARSASEEERLRSLLSQTELTNSQVSKDANDVSDRCREMDRELQRVRSANKVLQEEKEALRDELRKANELATDLQKTQESLQQQSRQRDDAVKSRTSELQRVKETTSELERTIASLNADIETERARAHDADVERKAAEAALDSLKSTYEQTRERMSATQSDTQSKLSHERERVRQLEKESQAKNIEMDALRRKLLHVTGLTEDEEGAAEGTVAIVKQLKQEISSHKERIHQNDKMSTMIRSRLLDILTTKLETGPDDAALSGYGAVELITELAHRVSELNLQLHSYVQFAEGIRDERNSLAGLLLDDNDIADIAGSDASTAGETDNDDGVQEEQKRWVRAKVQLHTLIRAVKSKRKENHRLRSQLSDTKKSLKEVHEQLLEKEHQLELRADTRVRFLVEQRPLMLREIVLAYEGQVTIQKLCRGMQTSLKSIRVSAPGGSGVDALSQDTGNVLRASEGVVQKLQGVIANCFTEGEKTSAGVSSALFAPTNTPDSARGASSARSSASVPRM